MSRYHHHKHLDGRRWQAVRKVVFRRDNQRCQVCGKPGFEVDHVKPMHQGGDPWALDNLQTICRQCHIEKTRKENRKKPLSPERQEWRSWLENFAKSG